MPTFINRAKAIQYVACAALCAMFFSFSTLPGGGEGFEIYLNNRLVLQQFNQDMKVVKTLKLDQANENDQLSVKYHHCGRPGKNRTLTIRDGKDEVLRQWKFDDESNVSSVAVKMDFKVKDILGLQKGKDKTIKLYYSSSEIPQGRQLASIVTNTRNVAKL